MKTRLLTIAIMSIMSTSAFAETAKETVEKVELDREPSVFDENNHYSYELLEKESVGNRSMDKILSNYHKEFKKRVKTINKEMDSYMSDVFRDIDGNIKDGKKNIAATEKLIEKNCSGEITEESVHTQCQALKARVFEDGEKVKSMELEKVNFTGQIETDRKNSLKSLYVNYKNLVGKSKADYESKK